MSAGWRRAAITAFILIVLSGLWLAMQSPGWAALFRDSQHIIAWMREREQWAPLAIVVLQIAQVLLAPIPGQVVGVAAGYLFGACLGTLYSLLGTAIGSWIALALARAYGRPMVEHLVSPRTLGRLDAGARRRGLFFFAIVFLVPFLPDDLACFAAGLTQIPIPALMAAAITFRAPGLLVSAWLGANSRGLSTAQWAILISASILLAGLYLTHGEGLQHRLIELLAGEEGRARPHPPSHEA